MTELFTLIAQSAPTTQGTPPQTGNFLQSMLPIMLALGVFWWIMSRGKNKERKRYEDMINALGKNDRVQTIGGIIGTIVDVRDDEVLLKVDESANVKMRFNRAAIKGPAADSNVDAKS